MKETTIVILILMFICSCTFKKGEKEDIVIFQVEDNLITGIKSDYSSGDSIANYSIDGVRQLNFKFNVDTSEYFVKESCMLNVSRPPSEVVKEGRILKKIKHYHCSIVYFLKYIF